MHLNSTRSSTLGRFFTLLAGIGVLAAATAGCAPRKAWLKPTPASDAAYVPQGPKDVEKVEVLLDREPDKPFVIVGELEAKALQSPQSIEQMRAEAARAGFDGIYWIECASPRSGRCTAKGYVYDSSNVAKERTSVAAK